MGLGGGRHMAAEVSVEEVLLAFVVKKVQREEGVVPIAAQRAAQRLFT